MQQATEGKLHSPLLQEVSVSLMSSVYRADLVCAGGSVVLVRQLLALGSTGARKALATAVIFGHTEIAKLLQVHCRIQHYMCVMAARCDGLYLLYVSLLTL